MCSRFMDNFITFSYFMLILFTDFFSNDRSCICLKIINIKIKVLLDVYPISIKKTQITVNFY